MPKPKRYRPAEEHLSLTVNQIAREIDRTPAQTRKLLAKVSYLGLRPRIGQPQRYDASAVEVLKGLLGIPHRHVGPPGSDWLSQHLGETDGRGIRPLRRTDHPRSAPPGDRGSDAPGRQPAG